MDERVELSGKFEEGKMLTPKPKVVGNENHNGSLLKMSTVRRE